MLQVLVCDDEKVVKNLFEQNGLILNDNSFALRALSGEEMLGFCLFEISGDKITVLCVNPEKDRLLADGLIRSTLHVGCERGVTEAFYGEKVSEELLLKIGFIEEKANKKLKLQNLYSDCCNCSSKQKG